jgi:hypothetical protein
MNCGKNIPIRLEENQIAELEELRLKRLCNYTTLQSLPQKLERVVSNSNETQLNSSQYLDEVKAIARTLWKNKVGVLIRSSANL